MQPTRLELDRLATAVISGELPGVSTDTRTLAPGQAFFALTGDHHDGAAYVAQALAAGARQAVVGEASRATLPAELHDDPRVGYVADARGALGELASLVRRRRQAQVVAITGSAGKTTTKELLFHMLRRSKKTVRAPKSFNNDVGVPLTILSASNETEVLVLEVGTSGPGEIARLGAIARPDLAVITLIAPAHLEGLGSVAGVAKEKLSLLGSLTPAGVAVLNGEDARLRAAASAFAEVRGRHAVTLCGLTPGLDLSGRLEGPRGSGASLRWPLEVQAGGRRELVQLGLRVPSRPQALDALLALGVAMRLGVSPEEAARGLERFEPAPGRLAIDEVGGVTLIDDSYNANPASVRAGLEVLAELGQVGPRVAILGGMAELGEDSLRQHLQLGGLAARCGVDVLVTVGDDARAIAAGAREAGVEEVHEVADAAAAGELIGGRLDGLHGAAVLVKGSRVFRLERALSLVRQRLRGDVPQRAAA